MQETRPDVAPERSVAEGGIWIGGEGDGLAPEEATEAIG